MSVAITPQRNPLVWFVVGAQVFVLSLASLLTAPVGWSLLIFFLGTASLGLAWVTRAQRVTVYFDSKEAVFEYSRFNPFHQLRRVDLASYTRVYVSVSYETGACTIKLANQRGKHMQLAYFLAPKDSQSSSTDVYQLCESIAAGLRVKSGWGASTDAF
jgi:hypothetical protein